MKVRVMIALFSVALAPLAAAHESATGVVKQRMEQMERFEELIERVFAMMHGELSYDARSVQSAAQEIRAGAGRHMTDLFPRGSDGPPSEAKAGIWQDFETFEHYAWMLERWSGELAVQAGRSSQGRLPKDWEQAEMGPGMMREGGLMGRGGMMNQSGAVFAAWHVAATCNACHADFREEE
ncbi:cytochrome c [Roseovarius sp. PS-C2]|uniref:c-type cytochrome n=1 Tax=Roseovarius sp. PS-C2 TaxID=2820814 RepID=UPI001C0C3E06|nr:cytochrome c [Roseovarius sp. PS-C2]MBU3260255.1 cytochrome c [Roseovarius sp. PS-C2]